jgi:acetyl-CoA carboxylase biotin carboxyl carrier protein
MDIRKIKKLIELLEEYGMAEIEIREDQESLRISRYPPGMVSSAPSPFAALQPAHSTDVGNRVGEEEPATEVRPKGHLVRAPMVGTFYRAPSPGADPFVVVGQHVEVGDTLCIVEAMKILNQIEVDRVGMITAILVDNGKPVEYGQPMFSIE